MNKKKLVLKWLGMAAVLVCAPSVWAAFTDGFESGLGDWTYSGQVQAVQSEYARDFLAPAGGDWLPTEGLWFASLWSTDSAGGDSSEMSRTFDGIGGEVLQFDYYFDFGDFAASDAATAVLSWSTGSSTLFEYNTPGHELADDQNVGWTHIAFTLPDSIAYTLTFSVWDSFGSFESVLGVDRVSTGQAVVPTPGAILLGIIGISTYGVLRKKRP